MIILRTAGVLLLCSLLYFSVLYHQITKDDNQVVLEEDQMKMTPSNLLFIVVMLACAVAIGGALVGVWDWPSLAAK